MAGAMFSLREFEGEARRSREMLSLQVNLLSILNLNLMIFNLLVQVQEAKDLLASQARQKRSLLEEVSYHCNHIFFAIFFFAGKREDKGLRKVGRRIGRRKFMFILLLLFLFLQ